ncbi:MAG TPA: flagellar hook-associated protein FlgK [Bryobacteraceae bacterium]|jgi:flagellar hook-associated protein 1 FlgK|nr:flagellar hook-associated protein FlgK [Bryobacteraceae bacterium]
MGGLLASLQTSSTALDVFSRALGVDQDNISNASTPGYAAQRATILPIDPVGNGVGGSDTIALSSTGNSIADAAVQAASSEASFTQTQTEQLSSVNQLFDITGTSGILAAFQQFSTAFSNLSVTPNDPSLGAAALTAAGNVASAFQSAASSLDTQQSQVDSQIQSTVNQINGLARQIRQLNVASVNGSGSSAAGDAQLRNAVDQLSTLVDVNVTKAADGTVTVLVGGQLPLVIGDQSFALSANPSAAAGAQVSSSAGGNSPVAFSGQLGALLGTRNGALAQLLGSGANPGTLNALAAGFAGRVNGLLSSGFTAAGAAGVPIFTLDAADPTNAARTLALDPMVTPDQLGLATGGASPVANGIANQLAALPGSNANADQINGLSAQDLFGSIASSIGAQLADARTASTSDQATLTSAQSDRQQLSGVSLDQEAVTITGFERSYEASAKVISILDQLLGDTVDLIK